MNNMVRNANGEIAGFRCWTCRQVFDAMWGETCNLCRERQQEATAREDTHYWRHVAYELAGGDRAKVEAAGAVVCDKFIAAGRERVGPRLPVRRSVAQGEK